jgi:hypothetical protein
MHKTAIAVVIAAILAIAPAAVFAQNMQPGLWEMTMKNDAMKKMPQLTPQQIEMMKKNGVTLPDNSKPMKVCISKQQAERDNPVDMHTQQTGCTTKNFQKTAGGYSVDIVCDGPNMKGTGKASGTYAGKTAFSSVYDFTGTAQGHPVTNHVETSGKWLSADCGDVKPISEMMPGKK